MSRGIIGDNLFGDAESADELLALFAGAASVCWENPGGAGEFDSEGASVLVDAALDRLVELGWFGPRETING